MTQLVSRAVLSAMLVVAVLVLALAAVGLSQPDTAAADPPRVNGKTAHGPSITSKATTHARSVGRGRHSAPKPHVKSHLKKRRVKKHVRKHAKKHVVKRQVSRGLRAVQIANQLTGIPYVWGGASPSSGFDCSGLVRYVYGKLGISLPHYTVSQYAQGRPVSRSSLRPGDLVFFYGLGHVGIYAGGGKYIHAPSSGSTVRWASLASHGGYYGARRIVSS
jgi:cell wall-associated NlpC family hydrolase